MRKLRWAWVIPLRESCAAFLAWRARHRGPVAAAGLVLLVGGRAGAVAAEFRRGRHAIWTTGVRRAIEAERLLRSVWGELPSASVMVRGKTQADALDANDRVAAALGEMAGAGADPPFHVHLRAASVAADAGGECAAMGPFLDGGAGIVAPVADGLGHGLGAFRADGVPGVLRQPRRSRDAAVDAPGLPGNGGGRADRLAREDGGRASGSC